MIGISTQQPADAEELVPDTLLRAYRAIDRFDGRYPRAWLLTIMRRAELNRHRRRQPHLLDDPDADLDRLISTGFPSSAKEVVIGAAFDSVVDSALTALPDRHRQVVQLVDITASVTPRPPGCWTSRRARS
ncbi:RNA polymerase sigma factor [Nocardia puris]|uniref:RNA polymerase sigma factor n=1 Tax=Nocardia puris TaxID=208602 RepID=UPI001E4A3D1F|nr:RNA polymerase sigma factor [Nocardia puris]